MGVILSDSCFLKDKCYKYESNPSAECKFSNVYCPKLFRVNFLLNEALLSDKQKKYLPLYIDEDGTDREEFKQLQAIEANIEQFVNEGANLFIHSRNPGTGKTSWSIRMLQAYIDRVWYKSDLTCKILFVNVPRYLLALKDSISNTNEYADHVKKNILKADLVVFDEIGIKSVSQYDMEQLYNIIDTRINDNKSNIYTSNISGKELKDKLGERLYSRIVNMSCVIELHGQDKRGLRT